MLVDSVKDMVSKSYEKYKNEGFLYEKHNNNYLEYTRGKTIEDIWKLSKQLIKMGYKNKKIMLIGENSYQWAITYMAIIGYVGVAVLVDKDYTINDYKNIFNTVDDISLVIYTQLKEDVISQVKNIKNNVQYLCLQKDIPELIKNEKQATSDTFEDRDINKMCEIVFTSGTTARPKAIMLSQKNILVNLENLLKRTPMNNEDKLCLVLPLHHLYAGVHAYLYSYYTGMKIYFCNNINDMIGDMNLIQPTVFIGVPMIYEKILSAIGTLDLKKKLGNKLKYAFCGGANLKEDVKRIYKDNGINLLDAYGVSEMSSVISFSYPEDEFNLSQGTVFENQKVEIIDKDENGYGEIIVTGENMMLGYYNNEKATKLKIDERGFLHTGDIGYLDEKNRLYVKGRKNRVIVTGNGKNVYPEEIEKLIIDTGITKRVKVYEENNHIKALIISDESEEIIKQTIDTVNEKLPKFKKVKSYEVEGTQDRVYLK